MFPNLLTKNGESQEISYNNHAYPGVSLISDYQQKYNSIEHITQ